MKIIHHKDCKFYKNVSIIELSDDCEQEWSDICITSINQCIPCVDEQKEKNKKMEKILTKKLPLYKYVPYKLTTGLPPETQYNSVYISSYSKLLLTSSSKKNRQIQDKTINSHDYCSYRKY